MQLSQQVYFLIFITTLTIANAIGQIDTSLASKIRTNEIGISIRPSMRIKSPSLNIYQSAGISYKKVFRNWAIRSNFSFAQKLSYNPLNQNNNYGQVVDTLQYMYQSHSKTNNYIGRIGTEYRHRWKKKLFITGGADLLLRRSNYTHGTYNDVYRIDSISNENTANPSFHKRYLYREKLLTIRESKIEVGISGFLGLMIPLGKRWWVTGEHSINAYIGRAKTIKTDYVAATTESNEFKTSEAYTLPAIFSKYSLFYRF